MRAYELEAAGWLTSELLVRVMLAGRGLLGAGEFAAAELRIT